MDEELTPEQAERVRRLLAEARHTEPVPDDVVGRLDRVLADLADDPGSRPQPAAAAPVVHPVVRPVVRLDERRRRAARLLLAAAAVVVGGVAVAPLVSGGSDDSGGASAGSGADTGQRLEAPDRDEGQSEDEAAGGSAGGSGLPGAVSESRRSISKQPPQRVRPERFATDARQLRRSAVVAQGATGPGTDRDGQSDALSTYGAGCSPGVWGGGRYLRVDFDREAGWLVFRPPRGDTQVVDLFLCGEDAAERSATLPYR